MMDALSRAREYLRGTRTDGYRYDHPITILTALVAEIEAAPVAIMDTRDALGLCAPTEADFPAIYALQGKSVRLVVVDSGGAGEV